MRVLNFSLWDDVIYVILKNLEGVVVLIVMCGVWCVFIKCCGRENKIVMDVIVMDFLC